MRRLLRTAATSVTLSVLAGCFTTQAVPIPPPPARADTDVRGFVVRESDSEGREIEFDEVFSVEWGPSDLSIQGVLDVPDTPRGVAQRSYAYSDLSGVLARQLDADRTSIVVAASAIGVISALVYLLAERTGVANPVVIPGG